ncbi:MAG: hypothetical protein HYS07_02730 [Chlamydiae bacterium]|nr:hypothetical protein [Chlamydiota bacterium]MBI3277623.1 hypothetical protein [Chlamydiota bacterium]
MEPKKLQLIKCPGCGQKTPLKIEKIFDDHFNLTGEKKSCSFCHFEFQEGELPVIQPKTQKIFDTNAERHICKNCKNYVVNPWTQKCAIWNKDVTGTDSCEKFEQKKELGLS